MSVKFNDIDFELIYLGLLTKESVKPLSRWEKDFGLSEIKFLKSFGLRSMAIERYLTTGRIIEELIFSKSKELLNEYANLFKKTPIRYTPATIELEGRFFGYPDCCIRSYINYGELNNGFAKDEQALLFHWACPDCRITPKLIPRYRAIYEDAKRLKLGSLSNRVKVNQIKRMISAIGLATFMFFANCEIFSSENETKSHLIRLENDSDKDYLKDEWEMPLRLDPNRIDTDANGIPDGIQLAQKMWNKIHNPPDYIKIEENYFWGTYTCAKCGELFNMGGLVLINEKTNDSAYVSFLALHYMEQGSFAYEGEETEASGIINPVHLDSVLSVFQP